jgi:hypothetical protein
VSEPAGQGEELCPKCGQLLERVHFNSGPEGLIVYHGEPPTGILARLAEPFIGSPLRTESGKPALGGYRPGYKFPALHCPRCREITIRYGP